MDIVERVKNIIIKPAETWPIIEQETCSLQTLYVPYMLILAAIPAVAGFIGFSIVGMGGFGMSVRIPIFAGLGMMISQYIMTLVMVGVWGWLINLLAGSFGGQANLMNAVKLSVYASTPALVAGVFSAIPGLAVLGLVGSLYSLYVLYLGIAVLMKNPPEKSLAYVAVAAVIGVVGSILNGAFSAMLTPSPMSHMQGASDVEISTPQGDVKITSGPATAGETTMTIKTPDGEVKIDTKNMEEFAKKMEALAAAQEAKK